MKILQIVIGFFMTFASTISAYSYETEPKFVAPSLSKDFVWSVIKDLPGYGSWSTFVSFEVKGPVAVGTDILIHVRHPQMTVDSPEQISVLESSVIGWTYRGFFGRAGLAKTQRNIELKEIDGKLAVIGNIVFEGLVAGLAWFFMSRRLKALLDDFNQELADHLSSLATAEQFKMQK